MLQEEQHSVIDHANHILRELREVVKGTEFSVWSNPKDMAGGHDWDSVYVYLTVPNKNKLAWNKKDLDVAVFQLQQMPGCCAIMTVSYLKNDYRVISFVETMAIIENAAKRGAFGSIVMTQVIFADWPLKKHSWYPLVAKQGYLMSKPFVNGKSGNKIVYLIKNLGQDAKMNGFEEEVRARKLKYRIIPKD